MGNDARQNRRKTHGLVALSSVAVLTVYTAGFLKTRAAAGQLEGESGRHRTAAPLAIVAAAGTRPSTVGPTSPPPPALETTQPAPVIAAAPELTPVAPITATVTPAPPPLVTAVPHAQAPGPVTEGALPAQPGDAVPPALKDGKYYGWGSCWHGRIQARVIIEGGRITSSAITKCNTRYDCSWIKSIVPQVVERQSANVDYVTGATESADAFYYAVVEALNQAK